MLSKMWRVAALILAIGLQSRAVRADENPLWAFLFGHDDPRLTATGIGIGIASTGASYALTHKHGVPAVRTASPGVAFGVTSFGCAVLYPIVGTILLHRELTPREAYSGMLGCVVPFVGGWIMDQTLPHDPWYDGLPTGRSGHAHTWRHARSWRRAHTWRHAHTWHHAARGEPGRPRNSDQHLSAADAPINR